MRELIVGLVPLARVTFDMDLAEEVTRVFRETLRKQGFTIVGGEELVTDKEQAVSAARALADETFDVLLVFQATFADSSMIITLTEAIDKPLFIWSIPEMPTGDRLRLNSLCGVNLAAHALTLRQIPYDYVYANIDNEKGYEKLAAVTVAASVVRRLKNTWLGVVGDRPDGLDTCILDAPELALKLGVQVRQLDLGSVFDRIRAVPEPDVREVRNNLDRRLHNLAELEQKPVSGTLSTYVALNQIAKEEGLDGIAVRCWPEFFADMGFAACGAISLLTDNGIPASCEADPNGTITQLILQWMSDFPAFGTDIVSVDVDKDQFVVWHCGLAPLSMADPDFQPRGTIHSNRKLPLLMEFPLKPGDVTIARLSQSAEDLRMVAGSGEMLSSPMSFTGTSGVLRFKRPAGEVLDTILGEGLEHHISITYGRHYASLVKLAEMLNLPLLEL